MQLIVYFLVLRFSSWLWSRFFQILSSCGWWKKLRRICPWSWISSMKAEMLRRLLICSKTLTSWRWGNTYFCLSTCINSLPYCVLCPHSPSGGTIRRMEFSPSVLFILDCSANTDQKMLWDMLSLVCVLLNALCWVRSGDMGPAVSGACYSFFQVFFLNFIFFVNLFRDCEFAVFCWAIWWYLSSGSISAEGKKWT